MLSFFWDFTQTYSTEPVRFHTQKAKQTHTHTQINTDGCNIGTAPESVLWFRIIHNLPKHIYWYIFFLSFAVLFYSLWCILREEIVPLPRLPVMVTDISNIPTSGIQETHHDKSAIKLNQPSRHCPYPALACIPDVCVRVTNDEGRMNGTCIKCIGFQCIVGSEPHTQIATWIQVRILGSWD